MVGAYNAYVIRDDRFRLICSGRSRSSQSVLRLNDSRDALLVFYIGIYLMRAKVLFLARRSHCEYHCTLLANMSASAAESNEYALYHYSPSVVAAIIFAVLFGATTSWHIWQMFQRRTWYFTAFVIGGLCE